jgi:hypothetical protein
MILSHELGTFTVESPRSNNARGLRCADHPDRLRLSIHDGVEHRISSAMREEVCRWFTDAFLGG